MCFCTIPHIWHCPQNEEERGTRENSKGITHTLWTTESPFPVLLAWNSVFSWGEKCLLHSGGSAVPRPWLAWSQDWKRGKSQREFPPHSLENWNPLFLLLLERDHFSQSFSVSTCRPVAHVILTPVQIQESKRKKQQHKT